jgi:hypothetical protein
MNATQAPSGDGGAVVHARLFGEPDDVAVERHAMQVDGEVEVPGVVAGRAHDQAGRVGQPGEVVVLELAGCEVARRPGAVGRDDVHVLGPVEHPVLAVEPGEEPLDLAGRLPGRRPSRRTGRRGCG